MTPDERWLAALWPSVRAPLPAPPARVLEIGCGPLGGFVPMLRDGGYEATGIDPEAPEGTDFRRVGFEDYLPSRPADAIIRIAAWRPRPSGRGGNAASPSRVSAYP